MRVNFADVLHWTPRVLSFVVAALVAGFLFSSGVDFLLPKTMASISLLLTALISWKSEPLGGGIFIILGSLFMVVAMGNQLTTAYFTGVVPLFTVGSLFIADHLYQEKLDQRKDIDL
jgi:hypothetical protein